MAHRNRTEELSIRFWGKCILTAGYLINLTSCPTLGGKTPYELIHGKSPSYDHLRVFGSLCYAHNQDRKGDKFDSKSLKCIFVGYPYGQKGWKLFDLEKEIFFVSRDVKFVEIEFPFEEANITSPLTQVSINAPFPGEQYLVDDDTNVDCMMKPNALNLFLKHKIAKMQRLTVTTNQKAILLLLHNLEELRDYVTNTMIKLSPSVHSSATSHHSAAMANELQALQNNGIWTLSTLPPGKEALGCKWIYKIKYHSDSIVERFKARLVILGNYQVEGN
ncbi:hypothetical protein V8G54_009772 [Vigna mungo]|uniref:Retroviral polymerase SH3-like domain-containing protein n=1 Tax=Vigna mungo TaxID=3915 RepID=A0AAQ3NVT8_VIGMU